MTNCHLPTSALNRHLVLIGFMGVLVGFIAISIMAPMFKLVGELA